MEKYRIISRYEYYSPSGVSWTKWFQETFAPIADTEDELKDELKKYKDNAKLFLKATKRKIEYSIEKFEYKEIELKKKPKPTKHKKNAKQ